jgi:hypothetical protein
MGPQAHLHKRNDFAFEKREICDNTGKRAEDDTNLDERN